jgi:hypothetical protein
MANHWYKPDGSPFYTTIGAKGQERDVTLRDARLCGAAPSVTTVLEVLPKPGLERWKVQQGILAALTMPRGEDSEEAWLAKVMADSKRQAKEAAEEGSRIHDASECFYLGKPFPERYQPHVEAIEAEIARLFPGITDWVIEKSFYHPLGFGGRVDRHSPATGIVLDLKGKDGPLDDGKKLAFDQHVQLAPYQYGLGLNQWGTMSSDSDPLDPDLNKTWAIFRPCANIFVSRTHPGKVCSHVWDAQDVAYGWSVFEAALELWKRLSRYNPADYIQPCVA